MMTVPAARLTRWLPQAHRTPSRRMSESAWLATTRPAPVKRNTAPARKATTTKVAPKKVTPKKPVAVAPASPVSAPSADS